MTNEQQKAKELAELLNAFAEGKQLQFFDCNGNQWEPVGCTTVDDVCKLSYSIRIKPETKRIALNQQDLIDRELSGKTMRLSNGDLIISWNDKQIRTIDHHTGYDYLLRRNRAFLDGTPCYKEVEDYE